MMAVTLRFVLPYVVLFLLVGALSAGPSQTIAQPPTQKRTAPPAPPTQRTDLGQGLNEEKALNIHYLEIVTPKVDETCAALEKVHGVTFGKPIAEFGNARMTKLKSGGRIGVRASMRDNPPEEPVVCPYILVDDIDAAVEKIKAAGGEFAVLPTEMPGEGKFAIYFLGGVQYGLWQR